jgi:hypothetical protein
MRATVRRELAAGRTLVDLVRFVASSTGFDLSLVACFLFPE